MNIQIVFNAANDTKPENPSYFKLITGFMINQMSAPRATSREERRSRCAAMLVSQHSQEAKTRLPSSEDKLCLSIHVFHMQLD